MHIKVAAFAGKKLEAKALFNFKEASFTLQSTSTMAVVFAPSFASSYVSEKEI
jgi:hypothetical protein